MKISELKTILESNQQRYLRELAELIAFKSVANNPENHPSCLACAKWLETHLSAIGFKTELLPTDGQPIVYAELIKDKALPTVLVYGHYDVQPADLSDGWDHDPFNMKIKGDDFFARGAGDNKGQTFYIIKAAEELIKADALSVNLKFMIEGEEEIGSPNTITALPKYADKLSADSLLICDDLMFSPAQPVISIGMRGIFALNIKLTGPSNDLHSGLFGGLLKNPAAEISKLVASLFNADGSIAVAGYYDNVSAVSDEDQKLIDSLPAKPEQAKLIGMPIAGTEKDFAPLESNLFRPTIEINGIQSGYNGPGSKSVIPAEAIANISCRTVHGQDSDRLLKLIQEHLKQHCPEDLKLEFTFEEPGCPGFKSSPNGPLAAKAKEVLDSLFPNETIFYSSPATIPIIPHLHKEIASDIVVTGFGHEDDAWHGLNEKFSVSRFRNGFVFTGKLLGGGVN